MIVNTITWTKLESQFTVFYSADLNGLPSSYVTWVCRNSGETKLFDIFKKLHRFDNIDAAKEFAQNQFSEWVASFLKQI